MIKSNAHTHTIFCDGKNTAEEMINEAINLGFKSLGFSFHSPMPYENDYAIKKDKVGEYYKEIERVKSIYADKIEILNGIEMDYDSIGIVDLDKFEYIIGSVHQIHKDGKFYYLDNNAQELKECVNEFFDGDWNLMAEHYYNLILDFVKKVKFDIVGHFDLITKFNKDFVYFDEDNTKYLEIAKNCLDEIYSIRSDLVFEVNTGAMFRLGNTTPYPNKNLLKHMNKLGFKIMINSDSHSTNSLDFKFDEAIDYCKSCGYTSLEILTKSGFKSIDI
ncbi:MAG: histidinol-phosphatase [Clostridia bacterium]